MGPSGFLVSPMTTMSPRVATRTQLPASQCRATRHESSPSVGGMEGGIFPVSPFSELAAQCLLCLSGRELLDLVRAPDLGDQACGVPRAQSGVAQVFNCLAVSLDLDRALLVTVAEEALDKDNRPLLQAFPEFEEGKIAARAGMHADLKRDDLDCGFLLGGAFEDLVELRSHDRRTADLAAQDGFVEQRPVARRCRAVQQLLPSQPDLDQLLEDLRVHLPLDAPGDRPPVVAG